ncbi:MAG TPA: ankyrin repeat domain-containing protein, partial [Candidatus Hydrogenedentes bacterium]|nr:ankyrin repeat domain-containing protein [Candidatus Hydrogenedentota bacterium]
MTQNWRRTFLALGCGVMMGLIWIGVTTAEGDNSSPQAESTGQAMVSHALDAQAAATAMYESMLAAGNTERSLVSTLRAGDLYGAVAMINAGIGLNEVTPEGTTPLHAAAETGQHEAISLLIQHGIDPNQPDNLGNTALHLAAAANDVYATRQLIKSGAAPAVANKNYFTPLHAACETGAIEVARALLRAGADINVS